MNSQQEEKPRRIGRNVYVFEPRRASQPQTQAWEKESRISSPPTTPGMARDKQPWELRQPTPKINQSAQNHLKAHGHPVPQGPKPPAQDPCKQARRIGAQLKSAGVRPSPSPAPGSGDPLKDARQAGAALRRAGAQQNHNFSKSDWQKTAQTIEGQLNRSRQQGNPGAGVTAKSARNEQERKPGMER